MKLQLDFADGHVVTKCHSTFTFTFILLLYLYKNCVNPPDTYYSCMYCLTLKER